MNIEIIKVGRLECNCYILRHNNEVIVIDPGDDFSLINKCIGNDKVLLVLITHRHSDHIGALKELIDKYNVDVYDRSNLLEKTYNFSSFSFDIIYTPGHSDDSISIYFPKLQVMFVGDFIFEGSIGRCDLDTGNINKMKESLRKISNYEKDIVIYPGHGNKTTLGIEINNNNYFSENFLSSN